METSMMVNGIIIYIMVRVHLLMLMDPNMKDNGKTERKKEKVHVLLTSRKTNLSQWRCL